MSLQKSFDIIRSSRKALINFTADLSPEQLNYIPTQMKNNIIWNIGHVIAVQQNFCYKNSDLDTIISPLIIERYWAGTKPDGLTTIAEYELLRADLLSHVDRLEGDYHKGIFVTYQGREFKTYPGLAVNNIEEAVNFVAFHDGLHLGYVMALKHHVAV